MATGAYDIFTNLDLHYNALKEAVIDPVSTKPTNAPVGTLVYDTGENALYVCTANSGESSTWTKLATGGDATAAMTKATYLQAIVGMTDAGVASEAEGTLTGRMKTAETNIGTLQSNMTTAQSNITTLQGYFTNETAAKTYYKVGVNSNGVVVSGSETLAESDVTGLTADLAAKAPLASPELTGTPTAPTAAVNTNTTQIATTAFVVAEVASKMSAAQVMAFKGTINSASDVPASPALGATYVVKTAGTYGGQVCEVGDMLVCTNATGPVWDVIQANIDGAVTGPATSVADNIAVFSDASGKTIKNSGYTIATSVPSGAVFTDTKYSAGTGLSLSNTEFAISNSGVSAGAYGDTANQTPAYGGTFKVPSFTVNAQGQLTAAGEHTVTIPASDNTDTLVKQNADTGSTAIPILLAGTSTSGTAAEAKYASAVTVTPSTGAISATTFTGSLTGNASTATTLANSRSIGLSGVTATAQSFDGSGDITIPVTAVPANLVTGVLDEARVPYVGGYETVTVATAGTAVQVTTSNCDQVYTATLYDTNGKVCMADITLGSGSVSVNCSAAGTYHLGWFGHRSSSS